MKKDIQTLYSEFRDNISTFAYNKEELIQILFVTVLIRGSILIEDLPWTWKTTLSRALAKILWFDFTRVQGTSDLSPQDILWGEYYDFESKNISIKKWPIFTDILLIDEINRMNPKTQSAFLQAMEEKKVTIVGVDYELRDDFFIIATQNPIEHVGTFPLPEAQKDRFTCQVSLWYPWDDLQLDIIMKNTYHEIEDSIASIPQIMSKSDIFYHLNKISEVSIHEVFWKSLLRFFEWVRSSDSIVYPLSQRAIATFTLWCRANAYIKWRDYVLPEDGEVLLESFLAHRLKLKNTWDSELKRLYRLACRWKRVV